MRIYILVFGVFFLLSKALYSNTIPFDSIDYYIGQNDYTKVHGLLSKLDSSQIRQPHDVAKLIRGVRFIINMGDYGEAMYGYEILRKQKNLDNETQLMVDFLGAKLYSVVDNRSELEPILERIELQKESFANDSLSLARYYNIKMNFEGMKGQFDEAMKYAIELLKYIDASQDESGKASVFLTIGEIFRFNERFDKALEYYRKAEDIALQYDLFLVLGKTYNNQSIIMKNLGDTLQEIEYLKKSIRYSQASGNKTSTASALYNLALTHLNFKQYNETANLLRQVVDLGLQYNFEKALYFGYYGYGMLYIEKKQFKDAKYYLDKAMGIAKQMNHTPSIGRIYFTYYTYYQKLNQYDKALHYYKLDQELRDSLRMYENQALIDGLEAKYQLSEKEKENQQLKLQQTERDAIIAKQRLTFFLIGALFLVLFFLVAIFYINLRNKNKQNLILQAQKMQMDEKNKLLTELNDEVSEQKFQLEEVNKVKDKMFSIISHDLRSPISSVYMLMRMVEQGNMDKEKSLGMLRELTHEVNQALFLLNNLLTWTHININPTPPHFVEVALSEVLNENIDFFETEFHYKGLEVVSKVSNSFWAWVDESMLHTVIQNLLSNAIKFSHVDTSIEIDAKVIDKQIVLHITNQGQIIEKSKIDQLFEVGERLGKGTKNERGGGLGLYISKYYTEAMGGALNLKPYESGTIVEVTFNIPGKLS